MARDLKDRSSKKIVYRADDVQGCAKDLSFTAVPTCDCLYVGVNHKEDDQEETKPDEVLEHLGDEVDAELELASKRAFEKRSVNPPVVPHCFEAYFESWSF